MWQNLSNKYNSKLIIIECVLDPDLHKQRIESRIRNLYGIPEVTWVDVENRRNSYLAWEGKRLILDTSNTREDNLAKVLEYVEAVEEK